MIALVRGGYGVLRGRFPAPARQTKGQPSRRRPNRTQFHLDSCQNGKAGLGRYDFPPSFAPIWQSTCSISHRRRRRTPPIGCGTWFAYHILRGCIRSRLRTPEVSLLPYAVSYILAFTIGLARALYLLLASRFPAGLTPFHTAIGCGLAGGFGGCTYCLRGIYLNYCVRNAWDQKWLPWYLIRPVVSIICGVAAYIFLSAGLLALRSHTQAGTTAYGFYAFAFLAGLNVDNFVGKIEAVAESAWGIKKSRAATDGSSAGGAPSQDEKRT